MPLYQIHILMKEKLRICVIQHEILWNDVPNNLSTLEKMLSGVTSADLIVLPEMFTTGFVADVLPPEEETSRILDWMQRISVCKGAALMGSVAVMEKGARYNRMFFIPPDGEILYYDKRHLFCQSMEPELFQKGSALPIFYYAGWKICPQICYDLRFPVWSRNRYEGEEYKYDLLVYVANWPEARSSAWNTLLSARALENQCYVVGCNCVGVDTLGHRFSGESQIVGPTGRVMERAAASSAQLLCTELSLPKLTGFRHAFPVAQDWDNEFPH